jgi:hypothetical protein
MIKTVKDSDGRIWTVQSTINWSQPQDEQFENDMAAGYVSGIAMLGVLVVLVLFVLFSMPPEVNPPGWLSMTLLLLLMLGPIWWALRRPWTIEASTSGEHWRGLVYGVTTARHDVHRVVGLLEERSTPDDGAGVLRQVT